MLVNEEVKDNFKEPDPKTRSSGTKRARSSGDTGKEDVEKDLPGFSSEHTSLMIAVQNGHIGVVKALLDRGVNVNLATDDGEILH